MGRPNPRNAIIVAHGAPSDPAPLDTSIAALARDVEALSDGFRVTGATLAMPGSLENALQSVPRGEIAHVYPFFMSLGWFVKKQLRKRVVAACDPDISVRYLTPFGLDDGIPRLCAAAAEGALRDAGHDPVRSVLVLAAHGSRTGHAAARAARAVATRIRWMDRFAEVRTGFVEEAPSIAEAASGLEGRPAICLPLFATAAGHVTVDVPEALASVQFDGIALPPIGEAAAVPAMIAAALAASAADAPREAAREAVR